MKVLSIDWDYFIGATADERYSLFPDGGNESIPEPIKDIIWATHYNDKLEKIGIKEDDYAVLKELVSHNYEEVMIADSHKHIYDFILDFNVDDEAIEIVNIDFHHDLYNANEVEISDVNCGNWAVKLLHEYDCKYTWVKREDSDKHVDDKKLCKYKVKDINDLLNEKFDILYICKSGIWSPPHLDKYFNEAFKPLIEQKIIPVKYQTSIFDDRYENENFKIIVNENKRMMEQYRRKFEDDLSR